MKGFLLLILALAMMSAPVFSQVSAAVHEQILKAEDARRYDKVIEDLMKNPNASVRERAALAAGRIGDPAAVPALVKMMNGDASDRVRETAAFALGEVESIEAADAVRIAIGETGKARLPGRTEDSIRGRLAEAAGKIAAANAKDPKAKELGQAILFTLEAEHLKGAGANKDIVLLALTAALRARPEGTNVAAAKFLASPDARIRADAANTLSRVRAKNANEALRKIAASDTDKNARVNAMRALGAAEDKEAFDLLLNAATTDKSTAVRIGATRALAALKDARAGERLTAHGEKLFAEYKAAKKPDSIPDVQNEFIEVATALGRLLANTNNERANKLFADFGKLDKGMTPEVYIARVRIGPKRGDGSAPELTSWKQYSTLVQTVGEFSAIEPTSDVGKQMKTEASGILRPLTKAFAEADPVTDKATILAAPDALRAFARFKTDDLGEMLRSALKNKDVFVRATAAELISELPAAPENTAALKIAFEYASTNDLFYNDASLAALEAYLKFEKEDLKTIEAALNHQDGLIRAKATELIRTTDLGKKWPTLNSLADRTRTLKNFIGSGTKNGQVISIDADYRRAAVRKNGSVRAVFTTQKGSFTIEFLPEDAPLTVDNFVKLARSGYFNGLEVHRVVPNFVMQDGDPLGNGSGGPGWSIRCEVNMVPYGRGSVGMALSGKDTGGSQWFVTHLPQPHLDGGYTVFGKVNETGMKVVDRIVPGDKISKVRIVGN